MTPILAAFAPRPNEAAEDARKRALAELCQRGEGSAAILWTPNDPVSLRPGRWSLHGEENQKAIHSAVASYQKKVEDPWYPLLHSPLLRPPPVAFRRFMTVEEIFGDRRQFEAGNFREQVWEEAHVDDQLRLLVRDGGRLLGLLAILRPPRAARFSRRDLERLQPLVGPLGALLVDAERRTRAVLPEGRGELLVNRDGRAVLASARGRSWLDATDLKHRLPSAVDSWRRGAAPGGACVLGVARARWIRMEGNEARFLVYLSEPPPVPVHTLPWLTMRQYQVAAKIVKGATVKEAAQELGLGPASVKTHLRAVYKRLGIGSRGELMERWERAPGAQP